MRQLKLNISSHFHHKKHFTSRRGDTIIEVSIAFTIFCLSATLAVSIMNATLANTEAALELTMTRNEIDAQSEVLRFIHNSYATDRELVRSEQKYRTIWHEIVGKDADSGLISRLSDIIDFTTDGSDPDKQQKIQEKGCNYATEEIQSQQKAFVLNTRSPNLADSNSTIYKSFGHTDQFISAPLYPRIVFKNNNDTINSDTSLFEDDTAYGVANQISSVEGIWIIGTAEDDKILRTQRPGFYDFHIYTCWYSPGNEYPTTIGTIIRLYNPEYIEYDVGGYD